MELKGKPKFNIDYSPSMLATSSNTAKEMVSTMIRYTNYGGQYSAQNLLPGESFTVTGLYGDNVFLMYLYEIAAGIIVLIIFLAIFFLFIYSRVRGMFERRGEGETMRRRSGFSFGRALIVGMFSGFIFVFIFFVLTFLSGFMYSGYGYSYQPMMSILFLLLYGIILVVSLFGLPYYLYSRHSKSEGVAAGIVAIISALVILFLISMLTWNQSMFYGYAEAFTKSLTSGV
jgi:hypothetical protein